MSRVFIVVRVSGFAPSSIRCWSRSFLVALSAARRLCTTASMACIVWSKMAFITLGESQPEGKVSRSSLLTMIISLGQSNSILIPVALKNLLM
ncbi:Uncharacterized protein HZ326_26846 [Fusarium oxysporum f. sp. albedinis]|nr:Uncharacterized protein HZ326_26846 [Fusarium oxysporum f. sp. albedinis]